MEKTLQKESMKRQPDLILWRHKFHAIPELSFEELKTTEEILRILKELGLAIRKVGVAGKKTGVVAEIEGAGPGPCIALRADIDALPVTEESNKEYSSRHPGIMHACGHDGHIAILLGVASIMKKRAKHFKGRLRFIFQPSEESDKSGAKAMIDEGALDGVSSIFGLHLWQPIQSGHVGYASGTIMAACDKFEITIQGKGGHGAYPHTAMDPIVAASCVINDLQSIVSREIDPLETAVVTVGKVEAGTVSNVIPEKAFLTGTLRSLSENVRKHLQESVIRIAEHTSISHRCSSETKIIEGYPSTSNDPECTKTCVSVVEKILGKECVHEIKPSMGADDMGIFLERVPGCYFFLGTGNPEKGLIYPHHHPRFDIDDDVLPLGVAILSSIAWRLLSEQLEKGD